jgi:nicotinamide mononucleotide transporter PnuC
MKVTFSRGRKKDSDRPPKMETEVCGGSIFLAGWFRRMHNPTLEWLAAATGMISVILTARRRIESWPVGLISVVAFLVFFFHIKLYADSGLQAFYLATGIYGWWHWARGGPDRGPALISVLTPAVRIGWVLATRRWSLSTNRER